MDPTRKGNKPNMNDRKEENPSQWHQQFHTNSTRRPAGDSGLGRGTKTWDDDRGQGTRTRRPAGDGDSSSETTCTSLSAPGSRSTGSASGRKPTTRMTQEITMLDMGFSQNTAIDWSEVDVPKKQELADLLETRIRTYDRPDVLVKVGSYEYRCHMMVLQSYSGFFADQHATRVELPEERVTNSAFAFIYDWMIAKNSQSSKALRRDNILEVFLAAQHLQVKELEDQCWALLDSTAVFDEEHAFLLYLEARRVGNTEIMELMVPRVNRFFLTLVASKEFVDMSIEEVAVFLGSSYVNVRREADVFMAAVRWLTYDWEERRRHVAEVMGRIRFGLMSPWHLIDIRRNPANREFLLVTRQPEVARMIDEGLAYAVVRYQHAPRTEEFKRASEELGLLEPPVRRYTVTKDGRETTLLYEDFLHELSKYRAWYLATNRRAVPEEERAEEVNPDTTDMILPNT